MSVKRILPCLMIVAMMMSVGCSADGMTAAEKRVNTLDMETKTLDRFIAEEPLIRREISEAAGYGVFDNSNINVILVSGGGGYGVVTDNSTGKKTYMKMGLAGIGLGIGAKDYRVLLIFPKRETMMSFIYDGWEFGGHADAAAKSGDKGGEASSQGAIGDIKAYSLTEAGLAIQATIAGTKYWKDDDLNE